MRNESQNHKFTAEDLMAEAANQTNLHNFGDLWFVPHLECLISEQQKAKLCHKKSRQNITDAQIGGLKRRLILNDFIEKNPAILDEVIDAPTFIIGLPRTGTTKLHRMLCSSQDFLYLTLRKMSEPSAAYETSESIDHGNIKALANTSLKKANEFTVIHELDPDYAEEESFIIMSSFLNKGQNTEISVPDYVQWVEQQDATPVYRELKRWFQYFQWRHDGRNKPWLFKSILHNESLEELLAIFPDAQFLQIHRDPCDVIASYCSLTENVRQRSLSHVDPKLLGSEILEFWGRIIDNNLRIRKARPDIVVHDFLYDDVVGNAWQIIEKIYDIIGLDLTKDARDNIAHWDKNNQQHKTGRHDYSLEKYGINARDVRQRFSEYCERYGV